MKDNLYTQSMKNIKAPHALVDDTITKLSGADISDEVITVEKPKHRAIKFTSAVAAVLALIIGLSVIPFGGNSNAPDSEHNFVITAGAAEITPETYIQIGELENFSDFSHFKLHSYLDENDNLITEDDDEELLDLMKEFVVDITCTGENIESVTYSANNCCLSYNPDYEGMLEAKALTEDEVEKYNASGSCDNFLWASACTFDYNCQPQSTFNEEDAEFEIPEEWVDGTMPLRMAFGFSFEEGEYVLSPDEDGIIDTNPIFYDEFNAHAGEFSLDITANFKDGKKTTKTLQFKCENDNGRLLMYAIEV